MEEVEEEGGSGWVEMCGRRGRVEERYEGAEEGGALGGVNLEEEERREVVGSVF